MRFIGILAALSLGACAPLLPYNGPTQSTQVRVYEPKVVYSQRYRQYYYVCKRGDELVRYRGRTVCYNR